MLGTMKNVGQVGGACDGLEPVIKIIRDGVLKYVCILFNLWLKI